MKSVSDYQSPFWILVRTTTSFPQTAPIVDAIFGPVTWHHQGRPFVCVWACKIVKTRRGLADEASSDGQVSQVSKERGRRRKSICLKEILIPPFIPLVCCMPILPLSTTYKAPRRRLISFFTSFDWSNKYWRLLVTKDQAPRSNPESGVRGLIWRANLAPL